MARRSPAEQLTALASAATESFGRRGYRGTRTADVARRAGMSSGSLFTYVESKEALFHLVFAVGLGQYGDEVPALPLAAPPLQETLDLIERGLRNFPAPRFRAALEESAPGDVAAELAEIVEERYRLLERFWPMLAVIERCAIDFPELEQLYFGRTRVGYHARLAGYLERRAQAGLLRATPDPAITARLISESIAWFAWHRREGRASPYDDEAARATVVDFVCSALLPRAPQ